MTDANFVLGRLDATLGGKLTLDADAAERAVSGIADRLGIDRLEAAEAIISITCENMAQAIKLVLTDRGRDPRDFVLASFGGAGPMHACQIARAMNIPRIVVPAHAGVASAFGATAMDIRHDLEEFYYAPVDEADFDRLNQMYAGLERQGRALLARDGIAEGEMMLSRHAQMRYVGQFWEVLTPLGDGPLSAQRAQDIADAFHDAHEAEHGVKSPTFPSEFVSIGVTAAGAFARPTLHGAEARDAAEVEGGTRAVYFGGAMARCGDLRRRAALPRRRHRGPRHSRLRPFGDCPAAGHAGIGRPQRQPVDRVGRSRLSVREKPGRTRDQANGR